MAGFEIRRGAIAGVVLSVVIASASAAQSDSPTATFFEVLTVALVMTSVVVCIGRWIDRSHDQRGDPQ